MTALLPRDWTIEQKMWQINWSTLEVERAMSRLVFWHEHGLVSARLVKLSPTFSSSHLVSPIWDVISRLVSRAKKRAQNLVQICLVWLVVWRNICEKLQCFPWYVIIERVSFFHEINVGLEYKSHFAYSTNSLLLEWVEIAIFSTLHSNFRYSLASLVKEIFMWNQCNFKEKYHVFSWNQLRTIWQVWQMSFFYVKSTFKASLMENLIFFLENN